MIPTRLTNLRRGGRPNKARALFPYLLLPLIAFLVVSPLLARFLVGLPAAWAYARAPGCDSDSPDAGSPCRVETLTVTRKWQERTGRSSFDSFVQLRAAGGATYAAQLRDGGFWTALGETRPVTGQVWQPAGQGPGQVMWLRDGVAEAQTEDHPTSRARNALFAAGFISLIALIALWRGAIRR